MRRRIGNVLKKIFFFIPPRLMEMVFFEIISLAGRLRAKPLVLNKNMKNYINMGSGENPIKGFLNVDFFTTKMIDYGADLRFPLKMEDDSVDGILCEHTLEHLKYGEVDNLLRECHRILKPNCVLRIILPDLSVFIRNYCENNRNWFDEWEKLIFVDSKDAARSKRRLVSPLESISFVTQEYGHVSAWDLETLKAYLEKNHFRDIKQTGFRIGTDESLLHDMDAQDRKLVSLYAEAIK